MAKIAVVIPVRNAERTLRRSVESVFNQSLLKRQGHEVHVILVYNGCTDASEDLGHVLALEASCEHQQWIQSTLTVVEIKMPDDQKGIVPALNAGLREASRLGVDFIARQDADDAWLTRKLEIQLLAFQQNPDLDVIGTQITLVQPDSYETIKNSSYPMLDHQIRAFLVTGNNPIAHPTVMFRERLLNLTGGYDDLFPMAEDLWLWMKASRAGLKMANLQEVFVLYTSVHNPNYTPLAPQLAAHTYKQICSTFKR